MSDQTPSKPTYPDRSRRGYYVVHDTQIDRRPSQYDYEYEYDTDYYGYRRPRRLTGLFDFDDIPPIVWFLKVSAGASIAMFFREAIERGIPKAALPYVIPAVVAFGIILFVPRRYFR